MIYDIVISSLAATGIVGALVYSYRLAHSRVFPVGIVNQISEKPNLGNRLEENLPQVDIPSYETARAVAAYHSVARDLNLAHNALAHHRVWLDRDARIVVRPSALAGSENLATIFAAPHHRKSLWRCRKCRSLQSVEETTCKKCGAAYVFTPAKQSREKPLNTEVTELSQRVKSQAELLRDFERRIRRLEKESIKNAQQQILGEEPERHPRQDLVN